jgi:two-component system response regulator YesN
MDDNLLVMIVEDETRIAILIQKLIHWDELHLRLSGVYANGVQALEAAIANPPDILITDIKMPEMDGIELIRNIRERGIDTQIILISGFREFEYARTAISYGVNEYLVKPIKESELNSTISKIYNDRFAQIKQHTVVKELTSELRLNKPAVHREIMRILETGSYTKNCGAFNEEHATHFKNKLFRVIIIKLDPNIYSLSDSERYHNILYKISEIFETALKNNVYEIIMSIDDQILRLSIVINYDPNQETTIEELEGELLNRTKKVLFEGDEVTIALGGKEEFSGLQSSFTAAEHCISSRIIRGTGKFLREDKAASVIPYSNSKNPIGIDRSKIEKAVQAFSETELTEYIDSVFEPFLKDKKISAETIYKYSRELITSVYAAGSQNDDNDAEKNRLLQSINHCTTVSGLLRMLKEKLLAFLKANKAAIENQASRPIREAMRFIDNHYHEKITLENVSELAKLNPTYFSILFKKETGMNFSSYLSERRMECAKTILRTTNDTIESISAKIGFADTRHFSETFTKIVGMKPSLYRRLYS